VRSTTICGGAKSTRLRRAGSNATTAMSHSPVFASSTSFAIAVYSMIFAGTPARAASARPMVTVVPVTSPLALSRAPSTGLPVKTATRSVPVGASSALSPGLDAEGVPAQPGARNSTSAATGMASGNSIPFIRTSSDFSVSSLDAFPLAPRGVILYRARGVIALKKEMEMNRRKLHAAGAVVAAAVLAGGCVSQGTYDKLEEDKNQEIGTLQKQRGGLQDQVQALQAQRSGLEQQKTSLEQQQADLRKQIDALEQQKAQLLTASQQTLSQYDSLVRNLTEEVKKGELQVRQYKDMLTVDVAEQLFFDSGRANLKDTGKAVLKKVGEALKGYEDKVIRIVGHTDNVPISKAAQKVFPSNWELSVARATTVVRYLQEVGIPPERMIASGRAEYQPIAENETPDGRKKNRRIEITLVDRNAAQEAIPARQ